MHRFLVLFVACLGLLATACAEQYCQRGAQSGTRCYNINEVEWQETNSRPPPPPERATQPAPGCWLLTKEGVYVMPQGTGGSSTATPPSYLMSGACVTRRVPNRGAQ
jgi:hypothetical protein